MDVLLVVPPVYVNSNYKDELDSEEVRETLGAGYLSASLKQKGISAGILNWWENREDPRDLIEKILAINPVVLGITVPFVAELISSIQIVNRLREKGFSNHITIGGHPPSFSYDKILNHYPGIDTIVRGEGEETFTELVERLLSGEDYRSLPGIAFRHNGLVTLNTGRELIRDLDSIPFPDRTTITSASLPLVVKLYNEGKINQKVMSVLSSRGCFHGCTYCSVQSFFKLSKGKIWRVRSPLSVVDELEYLNKEFGIRFFIFCDDNFIGDRRRGRERAYKIAEEILRRKLDITYSFECRVDAVEKELFLLLKKSGLDNVFLGVESGVQRILDTLKKRATVEENYRALALLKELNIKRMIGFMIIDPYTSFGELKENLAFLQKSGIYRSYQAFRVIFKNKVAVFSGTPLEKELLKENLLFPLKISEYGWFAHDDTEAHAICRNIQAVWDYRIRDEKTAAFYEITSKAFTDIETRALEYQKLESRYIRWINRDREKNPDTAVLEEDTVSEILADGENWKQGIGAEAMRLARELIKELDSGKAPLDDAFTSTLVKEMQRAISEYNNQYLSAGGKIPLI